MKSSGTAEHTHAGRSTVLVVVALAGLLPSESVVGVSPNQQLVAASSTFLATNCTIILLRNELSLDIRLEST